MSIILRTNKESVDADNSSYDQVVLELRGSEVKQNGDTHTYAFLLEGKGTDKHAALANLEAAKYALLDAIEYEFIKLRQLL